MPIPLVGFANLAHMGAYPYMPSCFVKLSFKFKKNDIFMRKYHMRATYVNRKVAVSVQFSHPMKSTVQYVTQYLPAVALT